MATTVKVDTESHKALRDMSKETRLPIAQVIARLIREHKRAVFWKEVNDSFARLRADPAAWEDYQAEMRAWDVTLADGLEPEDWSEVYPEFFDKPTAPGKLSRLKERKRK